MGFLIVISGFSCSTDPVSEVRVVSDGQGQRLQVNGEDYMIFGMNWDYFPIGTNYSYNLWSQSDEIILSALANEMPLLKNMGVNTIRQYSHIPPRWVQFIYEEYGIFTVLNHSFARYGLELNGQWVGKVNYSDLTVRQIVLDEVSEMVESFHEVPGVLMWLLGNENNFGLFWEGGETENLPEGESVETYRARHLYSLFNEAISAIHELDDKRPVAIANGDLLFLDIIAEEIENLDVFGTNVYRGLSFDDLFQAVDQKLGIPVMLTEFGADAFHAIEMQEDQASQARYLLENWHEIYTQSSGQGKLGNAIGGFTFQFSDGWWKHGQQTNLDSHDTHASWSNGGYSHDFVPGNNNMNEEWFGICAKGPSDSLGLYDLIPRTAYYTLQEIHSLNPYTTDVTPDQINNHFSNIQSAREN